MENMLQGYKESAIAASFRRTGHERRAADLRVARSCADGRCLYLPVSVCPVCTDEV